MTTGSEPYPPSPVPSDRDLTPGELPFTAFGQFGEGHMDNRVFDQDIYWVNVRGEPFVLTEMPEDYRRNVIAFLHENVTYFYIHAVMREAVDVMVAIEAGEVSGAVLAHALGTPTTDQLEPVDWLEATPLMRRLRALTPNA